MATPITINSIAFQNLDYYAGVSTDYIAGNIGDEITCTINFELPGGIPAGQKVVFKNNLTNEIKSGLYPDLAAATPDYTIEPTIFDDEISGYSREWSNTTVGALTASTTEETFVTGSATMANVAGNTYTIVHVFKLTTLIRFEDVLSNTYNRDLTNDPFGKRYVFSIHTQDEYGSTKYYSTEGTDPLNNLAGLGFFDFGSVGAFDRLGQAAYYSLSGSVTGSINFAIDSDFSCTLVSTNGNFTATSHLKLFIQTVKDISLDAGVSTLDEFLNIETINFDADGIAHDGTNLLQCTATVDPYTPTQIDLSFTVLKGQYTELYAIWVGVSNDTANINHNNVLLQINDAISLLEADDSVITLDEYPGSNATDNFSFYQTDQSDVTNDYDGIKAFVEDRILSRWLIVNSDNANTTITNIQIVVGTGFEETPRKQFESLSIREADIPYTTDRNFRLENGDLFKEVEITKATVTTTDTYTFEYALQIWKEWADYSFLRLRVSITGTQDVGGTIISFTKTFESAVFNIGTYDVTKNSGSEEVVVISQRLLADADSVFLDANGIIDSGSQINGILKDADTYVQFVFQETNLGSMNRTVAELFAYIGINSVTEDQATYYSAISSKVWGVNDPFVAVPGHATNTSKISLIGTDKAKVEVILDKDKLFNLFPDAIEFQLSARLNSISLPEFTTTWNTENLGGTSSASKTIVLPLLTGTTEVYSGTIDWGDGNISVLSYANRTHVYTNTGTYTVKITGTCTGWRFNNGGDCLKITNVSEAGSLKLVNVAGAGGYFYGCANMTWTATDALDLTGITDLINMFHTCSIFNGNIDNWDISGVTNTGGMFRSCTLFNQPLNSWNVSNVTAMSTMFFGCSIFNQPLNNWDVSGNTDFTNMFYNALSFNGNITTWATTSALTFQNMTRASSIKQDLSNFNFQSINNTTSSLANFITGDINNPDSTDNTTNYDALIAKIAADALAANLIGFTMNGGSSHYGAGAVTDHDYLTVTKGWTITDGGTP